MVSGGNRTLVRALITFVIALALAATAAVPAGAAGDPGQGGFDQPSTAQLQRNLQEGLKGSFSPSSAADADLTKFVDGDLASDAVFFNGTAWDAARIQTFLNTKATSNNCVPATGGPACLNTVTMSTPNQAASAACTNAYTGQTGATAAQIISGVSVACGVNPVVLLAVIQREQGLVAATTPTQWMYDHATGWNCPDTTTGPQCSTDPSATGFFNQVYGAAWQFKEYGVDTAAFDYFPVGTVSPVRYNTDPTCGSKQVAIQNKATAALYYYTPYTPNAASLADYPGTGDACSAYGIRNVWYLFNAWYDGPSTAGSVPAVARMAGGDRFATSAAVSQAAFPSPGAGIPAAFIASGVNFPDALGAAPAAAESGGPLLLSLPTSVPTVIMNELARLKPATIYVAGGANALSDGVLAQLQGLSYHPTVTRIAGSDRFDTSRTIAKDAFPSVTKAYLANGVNFPDALSAGAAAGALGQPVMLVNGPTPDAATVSTLKGMGVTSVKVVGGATVIPDSYLSGLSAQGIAATRVSGPDRYATSLAISQDAFPSAAPAAFFASGATFPDALSGAAYAAKVHSPLLVTPGGCVSAGAAEVAMRTSAIDVVGGADVLADAVGMLSICQ